MQQPAGAQPSDRLARERALIALALGDRARAVELLKGPGGAAPSNRFLTACVDDESWDIMAWSFVVEGEASETWWVPAQSPENLELLRLNDVCFKPQLDRYKYAGRSPIGETGTANAPRTEAVTALLLPLEPRLRQRDEMRLASADHFRIVAAS